MVCDCVSSARLIVKTQTSRVGPLRSTRLTAISIALAGGGAIARSNRSGHNGADALMLDLADQRLSLEFITLTLLSP